MKVLLLFLLVTFLLVGPVGASVAGRRGRGRSLRGVVSSSALAYLSQRVI